VALVATSMPASLEFLPRRDSTPRDALSLVRKNKGIRVGIQINNLKLGQQEAALYRIAVKRQQSSLAIR